MATRMSNINNLFADQKTRTIVVVTGIMLISMAIWGFLRLTSTSHTNSNSASVAGIPGIESVPDPNQDLSPAMVQNIKASDEERLKSAKKDHVSAIPTLLPQAQDTTPIHNNSQVTANSTASNLIPSSLPKDASIASKSGEDEIVKSNRDLAQSQKALADAQVQLATQQAQLQQQALQIAMQKQQTLTQNMQSQAQAIFSAWSGKSGVTNQAYVQGKLAKEADKHYNGTSQQSLAAVNADSAPSDSSSPDNPQPKKPASIKAGDLVFGLLNTEVNSDEPGPILATIASGKYRGAKLVGAVQKAPAITGTNGPETVILTFTTMNIKTMPTSISINAIAIDPDTARTALASDVDYHRLYRYGTLFASSFLSGYGNAISQSGSVVINNTDGSQTTFQQELNPTETFLAALGQIGTELGNKLSDAVDRPNTITVNTGVSIGILFLSDVIIDPTAG